MRRARQEGGVAEWTYPHNRRDTRPTFTCCHCGDVTIVAARARAEDCGGFCLCCMKPTCKACAGKGCAPFEREIERQEARGRSLRSMGL